MAGTREENTAACWGTEQTSAGICSVGKDSDADTGVQMGARTEDYADSSGSAVAAVRGDNGEGSKGAEHADCKRRRVYKGKGATAGDTGG